MNFLKLFKIQKIPSNFIYGLILITPKPLSSSSESDNRSVEPMQFSTNPVVILPEYLTDFADPNPHMPYDPVDEILNLNISDVVLHQYDEPISPISSSDSDEVDSSTSGSYIMNGSYSFLTASDPSPHAMFDEIRHLLEKDEDVDR